ncbi:M48 family metalloprotease [Urechidicola croceus]|uniref:Uncharacterized protein n=1 Tax=Urechidicola croceus TaxID=1850246 RepID=A0A1D8P700_9FLAO|nr:hypothetical protein [Urechidicola croceus]AOW20332.1 hypothetical protein LPB138_06405 [Urechidicola croceus]
MKKIVLFINLLITVSISSQNYQTVEEVNDACAQLGFAGNEDAEITVDNILDKIGLFRNFIIQECPNINNAVAKNIDVGSGYKERYILYDSNFFEKIDTKAGNDWAATSVLAHEIGHHLNGHSLNDEGSNHKFELEADEFSGFVLARMGASLSDSQSAINTLRYEKATHTHPAKLDRLNAIEKGWNRGNGKTIEVKKIEEEVINEITEDIVVEDENNEEEVVEELIVDDDITEIGGVTPQQVFANYIEAIGGQEKVVGLKTMKQKLNFTSKTTVDENEIESDMKMELTFLTPNKYISEIELNGTNTYTLMLDGKSYIKEKPNKKWKFQSFNKSVEKQGNFIPEYSLLVSNPEVKLLGVKVINGERCFAVQMPVKNIANNTKDAKILITSSSIHYYNVKSGLLKFNKTATISEIDFINNTEYLKDSKTSSNIFNIYSDYRPVNGVLLPFYIEMEMHSDSYNSTSILKYEEIIANLTVDKEDFKVVD